MIGVYKQSYQAGMTCTHLSHTLLSPTDMEYVLPALCATVCLLLTLCGSDCPLHEMDYTSLCLGNPGPAHYPAPLRHSSL